MGNLNINLLSNKQIWEMIDFASKRMEDIYTAHPNVYTHYLIDYKNGNLWQDFECFGKDKFIFSYYLKIENDLTLYLLNSKRYC